MTEDVKEHTLESIWSVGFCERIDVEKDLVACLRLTTEPKKQTGTILLNGIATWSAFSPRVL